MPGWREYRGGQGGTLSEEKRGWKGGSEKEGSSEKDEGEQEDIFERMAEWKGFPFNDELQNQKILKLHSLLSKYKEFETKGTHFTGYNSGMIQGDQKTEVYYFVGSDSIESKENYVYIFKDAGLIESNLKVQFLGRVGKDNALYKRISLKE